MLEADRRFYVTTHNAGRVTITIFDLIHFLDIVYLPTRLI